MAEDTIKREDYAPITKGLRDYIERHPTMMCAVGLTDLCDNIDAIHKALEDECAEMRGFCERVRDAVVKGEDLTIFGKDYTALPIDADGVPIHIGDVMENLREDLEPKLHHRFKVYGIQYRDYGQVCTLTEDCHPSIMYRANECRHYRAPTVADVLREFARVGIHIAAKHGIKAGEFDFYADEEAIAEYAAKLRLAGDTE